MNISVRGRHVDVGGPFHTYAQRRLRFAVGEFDDHVSDIDVRITDQNGPRGGIDKSCLVAAAVIGGPLLARAEATNAYTAVDRAAQRLRAQVARRVERRRHNGGGSSTVHRRASRSTAPFQNVSGGRANAGQAASRRSRNAPNEPKTDSKKG